MKAQGYACGNMHHRLGWPHEVIGIDHMQLCLARLHMMHKAHQPAIIFSTMLRSGHKDELTQNRMGSKVAHLRRALRQVVAQQWLAR